VSSTPTTTAVEFTTEQIDFIVAIEQCWWSDAALPTDEKISDLTGLGLPKIAQFWKNQNVRGALVHRGIDLTPRTSGLLTIQQLDLANVLLNFADKRSLREKLNSLGITVQQYNAWMRKPAFRDYIAKRAEETFKGADSEAYNALVELVRDGDIKAIQLFFEMRGIYNPRVQVDVVNVQGVLVQVVEIISKHVKDPQILQAIATDFEALGIGKEQSKVADPIVLPTRPELERVIELTEVEFPTGAPPTSGASSNPTPPVGDSSKPAQKKITHEDIMALPKNEFDFKL